MDDDFFFEWMLGIVILGIFSLIAIAIVIGNQENRKNDLFKHDCYARNGHIENNLCVKGNTIIIRQD